VFHCPRLGCYPPGMSRCPRSECTGTSFQMHQLKISGCNYVMQSVECALCGAVVAVLDNINIGYALQKIGAKVGTSIP
jgi:hypothetical protein